MIKLIYPEFMLNATDVKFGDIQKLDASRINKESNSYKLFVQITNVDNANIYLKLPFLQISHASPEIKSENSDYIEVAIDYDKDDKENIYTFAFFDQIDKIFIDWITSNKQRLNPNNIAGIKIRYKPFIRINKSRQDNKCIKLKIIKEVRKELTVDFITTVYGDINNMYEPDMLLGSIIEIVGCIINNGIVVPLIRTDQCCCTKINRQITCCRKLNMCCFDDYDTPNEELNHKVISSIPSQLDIYSVTKIDEKDTKTVDKSSLSNTNNSLKMNDEMYPQLFTNNQIVLDNDSDSEDVDIIKTYKK